MRIPEVSKNTKLMGIASFLIDISSEMVYPLLPFFMTNILLAPVFVIGVMESAGEFISSVTSFLSGVYADRIGKRKKIIIFGYSLSAFFKGFLVIVSTWHQMVALRILERFGKGIRDVPRDALIGLSEEKNNLGNAFGFRKMLDNIGALLGPILASLLVAFLFAGQYNGEAYKTIFALALVPAVLAVLSLLFIEDYYTEKTKPKEILKEIFHTKNFKQFIVAGMVFSLGQFSMMFFLLRANDFMPLVLIPVVYLVYNVFYTIFSMPAGILSDKLGAKKALIFGMLCFLTALSCFVFFPSQNMLFIMFPLLGFFMAIAETAPQILLIRTVESRYYASAIGTYKGLIGMVALPANLIAGLLYSFTVFSSPATFAFSIVTTIFGIVLLAVLVREK